MPEGPEVYHMSKFIAKHLMNETITKFKDKKYKIKLELGLKVIDVFTQGKLIIIEFDNKTFLVNHLIMTGSWSTTKPKAYFVKINNLYFSDKRGLARFQYMADTIDLEQRLKSQSYDLLMAALNIKPNTYQKRCELSDFNKAIKNKRIPNKAICDFLRESQRVSGIGNYLRAEIIYAAKIHPYTKLKDLTTNQINHLYETCLKILKESADLGGCHIKDYIVEDSQAKFKPKVYKCKEVDGMLVQADLIKDKQTMHWVPELYKL